MIYFHSINNSNQVVFSNLPKSLLKAANNCPINSSILIPYKKNLRNGKIIDEDGSTYLVTNDKELVENPDLFKNKIIFFHSLLKSVGEIQRRGFKEALHDIQTIQGHNMQEIYGLISYETFYKDHKEIIETIEKIVNENPRETAYVLFNILKNATAIASQLTIIRLNYNLPFPLQIQEHDVKKVFLSVFHKFHNDFFKKHIKCIIDGDGFTEEIDYETFSGALTPIFDNLVKYVAPDSTLEIEFIDGENKKIKITMFSLKLEKGEEDKIFQKNYSGENAIKFKINGSGLGMHNAKKLLKESNVSIKIIRSDEGETMYNNLPHSKNILEIIFT